MTALRLSGRNEGVPGRGAPVQPAPPETAEAEKRGDTPAQDVEYAFPPTKVEVVNLPPPIEKKKRIKGSSLNRLLTENAQQVLVADDLRRRAVLFSVDRPIYIGEDSLSVQAGGAFLLNNNIIYEITHKDAVWAAVAQVGMTGILSVLVEREVG